MENHQWIWQYSNWPNFYFDASELLSDIAVVSQLIGGLEAISRTISDEEQIAAQERVLADDAVGTAAIEVSLITQNEGHSFQKVDGTSWECVCNSMCSQGVFKWSHNQAWCYHKSSGNCKSVSVVVSEEL